MTSQREELRRIRADELDHEQRRVLRPLLERIRRTGKLSRDGGVMLAKMRKASCTGYPAGT